MRAGPRAVGLTKPLEDEGQKVRRDALTGILYTDDCFAAGCFANDANFAARRGKLDRVIQQIEEHLEQARPIAANTFVVPVAKDDFQMNVTRHGQRAHRLDGFADHFFELHRQFFHPHFAAQDRRHIKQVVDQSLHGVRVLFDHRESVFRFLARQNFAANHVHPTNDWRQRRSQFM